MNVAIVAGSNHKQATSTKLAVYLQQLIAQEGHEVSLLNLYEDPLPFYSPEGGYDDHEALKAFKHALFHADAIVLTTAEYHSSISGVLKNALDHVSKDYFNHKAVLSVSSAGGAIAVSSLTQLQTIVRNLHGINSPEWISIGGDQRKSFQADSNLEEVEPGIDKRIRHVVSSFLDLAKQLSAAK